MTIFDIVLILSAFAVGILLGKLVECLFEVRVKQFQKGIANWLGVKIQPL